MSSFCDRIKIVGENLVKQNNHKHKFTSFPWELRDLSWNLDKSKMVITKTENGRTKTICRLKQPHGDIEEIVANANLLKKCEK